MIPRTWQNQFTINEEFPLTVPEFLLKAPWEDTSWGNDACPSFFNHDLMIRVFVDFDNDGDREYSGKKFSVQHCTIEQEWVEGTDQPDFDDATELEAFLSTQHNFTEDEKADAKATFTTDIVEAGKLLVNALDHTDNEEHKARIQAAIDELNTIIHS